MTYSEPLEREGFTFSQEDDYNEYFYDAIADGMNPSEAEDHAMQLVEYEAEQDAEERWHESNY